MSSPPPNPSTCCGVPVPCCTDSAVPDVLQMTVAFVSGCSLPNADFPIHFKIAPDGSAVWQGETMIDCSGTTHRLTGALACSTEGHWAFSVMIFDTTGAVCLGWVDPPFVRCQPFLASMEGVIVDDFFGCYDCCDEAMTPHIDITITE